MSSGPKTSKQQQDGTSRRRRMPEALHPEYVLPDERNREDLLAFAKALSAEIRYYNEHYTENGDWQAFFADEVADSQPHKALFVTFLELFKYAQEHLNTLTQRHLDFYYREVLRLKEKPATPDQVHVLFQLAKNVKSHFLQAGTLLDAGKDDTGVPVYYATEKDIIINKATIGSLKTLFIEKNDTDETQKIHAAPVADSADGLGTPFTAENPQWKIFGNTKRGEQAIIGFAIASPLLFLNEGERRIDILLSFSDAIPAEVSTLMMGDVFDIQLSGAEGWVQGTFEAYSDTSAGDQIGLTVSFNVTQPAITAYNQEIHEGCFDTVWPVMRILLKDHSKYDVLYSLKLTAVDLSVTVTGIRNLVLQNDQGVLDSAKPFLPFGPQPILGASFYIGNAEVFQKKLDTLMLEIDWHGVPQSNLGSYYFNYEEGVTDEANSTLSSSIFETNVVLLQGRKWNELDSDVALFETDAQSSRTIALSPDFAGYERNPVLQEINAYDQHTQAGFIKLELTGPATPFNAFGHAAYANLYTQQAIAIANGISTDPLPNEPYTPAIKSMSLEYTSTQNINFQTDTSNREQFFHITPFGHNERLITSGIPDDIPSLLPEYTDEGSLYIGIKDLEPPQQLSILFRSVEGSADPETDIRQEDIHWCYLSDGHWTPLKDQLLLSDTTNAFQTTGIITFNIPPDASRQESLMPEGLHWIRACLKTGAESIGKLIALDTQAVTATFTDQGNDPSRLNRVLEAGSISELASKRSAVKSVVQPYSSFNGKAAEQSITFYTRISELLRHKVRAISGWDYERLILEKFPSIYKVKCLNHTDIRNVENSPENSAGHVSIITLPKGIHKNAASPLEPKTGNRTLTAISDYLRKYMSPFVSLDVRNPHYEQVQLSFRVRFNEDADQGYYQQLLEEEVSRFLSPWAYEGEEEIVFGNAVYKSAVLNFVEKKPYVDFVTDFTLYHVFEHTLPDESEDIIKKTEKDIVHYYSDVNNSNRIIVLEFTVDFTDSFVDSFEDNLVDTTTFRSEIDNFLAKITAAKSLGRVQRAQVMKFIAQHRHIAFLRGLRLFHMEGETLKEDTEKALATRPGAILTSVRAHEIKLVNTDHQCSGNGISNMIVNVDFVVGFTDIYHQYPGEGIDHMIVETDFVIS